MAHRIDDALAQALARRFRAAGADGLVCPTFRHRNGNCVAAFWPDVVALPVQGCHLSYHWDGTTVDLIRDREAFEVER